MDRAHGRAATGLGVLLLLGALAAPAAARSPTITFYFGLERPEGFSQLGPGDTQGNGQIPFGRQTAVLRQLGLG